MKKIQSYTIVEKIYIFIIKYFLLPVLIFILLAGFVGGFISVEEGNKKTLIISIAAATIIIFSLIRKFLFPKMVDFRKKHHQDIENEIGRLRDSTLLHNFALIKNVKKFKKYNDYGHLVKNEENLVFQEFLDSIYYNKYLIKKKDALKIVRETFYETNKTITF